MMIAANEATAKFAAQCGLRFIYRNHEPNVGIPGREDVLGQVNNALLHPDLLPALRERMGLWMKRAEYGYGILGHYGLNLAVYAHTTSPIRRYVDLVNQRIIKAAIQGFDQPYSEDELRSLADEINAFKLRADVEKAENMRERTIEIRRRQLEDEAGFAHLAPAMFTNLLKRAVKDGSPNEAFRAELIRRMKTDEVGAFELYYLMFEPTESDWSEERKAAFELMEKWPHLGVSILEIHKSRNNASYELKVLTNGVVFKAWAIVGTGFVKEGAIGQTKKEAAGRAAVQWLRAHMQGLTDSVTGFQFEVPKATLADAIGVDKNYVGMLGEICQQRKFPMPEYTFKQDGPSHAPTITCRGSVRGFQAEQQAPSKKDAKQLVARQLLAELE